MRFRRSAARSDVRGSARSAVPSVLGGIERKTEDRSLANTHYVNRLQPHEPILMERLRDGIPHRWWEAQRCRSIPGRHTPCNPHTSGLCLAHFSDTSPNRVRVSQLGLFRGMVHDLVYCR